MSPKTIVLFALLAVASAVKPQLNFRLSPLFTKVLPIIVGGEEAPRGAYPFIVSLQWGWSGRTSHFCAGSILTAQWIITAAHCIQAVPNYGNFVIKAGKHNILNHEDTEQMIKVQKTFVHEQLRNNIGPYDIGLIKLEEPLKFTKWVQPISLPIAEIEPTGKAVLCGWGSISSDALNKPNELQHINVTFVDRTTCHSAVMRLAGISPVHENNVCTGPMSGGISACNGDSGGPLIKYYNGNAVLTGIVSWTVKPCGIVGAPTVHTKVSKYNSWIKMHMAIN